MSQAEAWTVGRLLTWTTDYLKQQGSASPRLDAELLLAESLQCERIALYTAFHQPADEPLRSRFRDLVRRRAAGVPVAYLLGRREFYSLTFHVTADVLIPRPETEFLIVELLDRRRERPAEELVEIADVGTGSGILAVCAARHAAPCRVTAIDLCPKALAVARRNALEHGAAETIDLVEGDLLTGLDPRQRFDFVLSNPPYVSDEEWRRLAPEVRDHEPRLALAAGPQGTEIIARLVPQAGARLRPGGWLIMEISPMIERAVRELVAADGRFEPPQVIRDLARLPRVVSARRSG